ncbi:MAG: hypothetical protein MUD16_11195 [Desulfobacterales bacterium]|jgi:hypothetical protein|nr:hypothetical protein [Desulfobacterales bacterium]
MEPVNFPRSITAVNRPARVKRVKSREESGQQGAFQKHLRRQAPGPAPPEGSDADAAPAPGAETPVAAGAVLPEENVPKQINIRV